MTGVSTVVAIGPVRDMGSISRPTNSQEQWQHRGRSDSCRASTSRRPTVVGSAKRFGKKSPTSSLLNSTSAASIVIERNTRVDAVELVRELRPATAAAYSTLKTIQRTIGRLYWLDPGKTDMEAAIEIAAELDLDVALIDEPIMETMAALSACVGWETLPKMLLRMQARVLDPRAQARQIDMFTLSFREITSGDDVQPAIHELRHFLPEVAEVLIDRRDRAMAQRLDKLRRDGHDVVAVIGAGHHNGIRAFLEQLQTEGTSPDIEVPIRSSTLEVTSIPIE